MRVLYEAQHGTSRKNLNRGSIKLDSALIITAAEVVAGSPSVSSLHRSPKPLDVRISVKRTSTWQILALTDANPIHAAWSFFSMSTGPAPWRWLWPSRCYKTSRNSSAG